MRLLIFKRDHNFYSVVDAQDGRELAVFSMYKQAMKFIKNYKGGCR